MWIMGTMTYLFPRLLNRPWYSLKACEWHFWLSTLGITAMAGDLTLLGLFQGWSWAALEPWDASLAISHPYWVIRVLAGLCMFGGLLVFLWNLWKTWRCVPEQSPALELAAA